MMKKLHALHFSGKGFVIWLVGTLALALVFGMLAELPVMRLLFNWGVPALLAVLAAAAVYTLVTKPRVGDLLVGACKGLLAGLQFTFTYSSLTSALSLGGAERPVGGFWVVGAGMAALVLWCAAAESTCVPKGSVTEKARVNYLSAGLFIAVLAVLTVVEELL